MKAKNAILVASLIALCLSVAPTGWAVTTGDPGGGGLPVCSLMSWTPEIFTFYGDSPAVMKKLQSIDRDLLKHRVFAFIVETKSGAHLSLFELANASEIPSAKTIQMASLRGPSFDALTHDMTNTLLSHDGKKCAGMLAHDLINQTAGGNLKFTSVSRPATMAEAFKEVSNLTDSGFIRATFVLLC